MRFSKWATAAEWVMEAGQVDDSCLTLRLIYTR